MRAGTRFCRNGPVAAMAGTLAAIPMMLLPAGLFRVEVAADFRWKIPLLWYLHRTRSQLLCSFVLAS